MNSDSVDLIYLDPPFNSNKTYAAPVGGKAAGAAFKDTWHLSDLDVAWMGIIADDKPAIAYLLDTARRTHSKGMMSYLTMMAVRLLEMRRVLRNTGSIYLHCDPTASHYIKALMDAIFGYQSFRNEIAWCYTGPGSPRMRQFNRKHDTILWYSVGKKWTFNRDAVRIPHKKLNTNTKGAAISAPLDPKTRERYLAKGKVPETWWPEFSPVGRIASERTGYPTQKPIALLDRIILASSMPGDIILDPFCGCATALVAAERLERQWVGIDISPKAADLVNLRLQDKMGSLFHRGFVTTRTDIPKRTDIDTPRNYRENKHILYGQQEGRCRGCETHFEFRNLTIDHVIPQIKGGPDHLTNLQLLCGYCNSVKGDRSMEYLVAQLTEAGQRARVG